MTTLPISIRTVRTSDADAVAGLTEQLGYDVAPPVVRQRLARILERSDQRFLIAEDAGRPVGWLHAAVAEFIEADPFVVIAGLVVDRNCRGRGIGRMLMHHAEQWAREQRCSIVRLWSSAGRVSAHRFYERLGYTHIKTQHAFAKSFESASGASVESLVPRIDPV
jgi:GNAT superfamily N-acetyltransferase